MRQRAFSCCGSALQGHYVHDEFDRIVRSFATTVVAGHVQIAPTHRAIHPVQRKHDPLFGTFDADFHEALVEGCTVEVEHAR